MTAQTPLRPPDTGAVYGIDSGVLHPRQLMAYFHGRRMLAERPDPIVFQPASAGGYETDGGVFLNRFGKSPKRLIYAYVPAPGD